MTNEGITRLARMAAIDFHITNTSFATDAEYESCWAAVEAGTPLPDYWGLDMMDEFRREEFYEQVIGMAYWVERLMKRARDE